MRPNPHMGESLAGDAQALGRRTLIGSWRPRHTAQPARGEVLPTILVLAAIAVGTALGIGSWLGRRLEVARTTIRQRAFALFWRRIVRAPA
jgi:hypothetical protein